MSLGLLQLNTSTEGPYLKLFGKIVLGVLSLEPLIFFAAFFLWLLPSFVAPRAAPNEPSLFQQRFGTLIPLAIASSVLIVLLLLVYVVLLARRGDLQVAEKIGVPLGILFSNGIILPLVWWLYIWRESGLTRISQRKRDA